MTHILAVEQNRPVLVVQLDEQYDVGDVAGWIKDNKISVLNIAGPRERSQFSIYELAQKFLSELFNLLPSSLGSSAYQRHGNLNVSNKTTSFTYPIMEEEINRQPELDDRQFPEYKV